MKVSLTQITQQIIDAIELDIDEFHVYEEKDKLPEIIESIEF